MGAGPDAHPTSPTPGSTPAPTSTPASPPPSYSHGHAHRPGYGYDSSSQYMEPDPRTSSSQSLPPSVSDSDSDPRRTLLLIYIHGFYGNDQSFRSFPYHVHSFLRTALAESHVIHSKIYPRYKTYRAIEIARDNFSQWLQPHESPTTDIILVGHSMGGILAADLVLMPNRSPYSRHPFKHRVLGTISLDSPFLGLHPGIIVSGISSLFQPAPGLSIENEQGSTSQSGAPANSQLIPPSGDTPAIIPPNRQQNDPLFDPPFFNDNPFKETPFIKRIMHFANKHKSEGIVNATAKHVLSHLEYGGCLADFHGLNARYDKIRALEDIDELKKMSGGQPHDGGVRVRFVNYYTLSSGRSKRSTSAANQNDSLASMMPVTSTSVEGSALMSRETTRGTEEAVSSLQSSTLSISVEDYSDHDDLKKPSSMSLVDSARPSEDNIQIGKEEESARTGIDDLSMQDVEPVPITEDRAPEASQSADLPSIPDSPTRPTTPDLDQYTDKESRKQAEKEFKRKKKSYGQAVKDRNKAIRERDKVLEKRRKREKKELEIQKKEWISESKQREHEEMEVPLGKGGSTDPPTEPAMEEAHAAEAKKRKKRKKFCTLPRKVNGTRDPTWVDVYMDGVDEVGAHCGLFFPGPHYDRLVGDVASRIIGWIQDDLTKRTILEMEKETRE